MTYDIYIDVYILLKTVASLNFRVHVLHTHVKKVKRAKISKKNLMKVPALPVQYHLAIKII